MFNFTLPCLIKTEPKHKTASVSKISDSTEIPQIEVVPIPEIGDEIPADTTEQELTVTKVNY